MTTHRDLKPGMSWHTPRAHLRLEILKVDNGIVTIALGGGTTAKREVTREKALTIVANFLSKYKSAKMEIL